MKITHLVNPKTKEFYHIDENYNLWSCNCLMPAEKRVSLCLSLCTHLKDEGEHNEIKRKVAEKRKELKLLESMSIEDIEAFKITRQK